MTDNYAILGLPHGASKEEIKRAYRRLAMMYHPDKNPSPEAKQKFLQIQLAYDGLMEGKTRSGPRRTYTPPPKPAAPPRPKYRTADEQRREAAHKSQQELMHKLTGIRNFYAQNGQWENNRRKMYKDINLQFGLSALIVLAGIFAPVITGAPGLMIILFPLSLGFSLRLFWKTGRRKMRADMIFSNVTMYSLHELHEFFEDDPRIGKTGFGGGFRP
jgi:hypothetical protein